MKRIRILCTKKAVSGNFIGEITHIGGVNGTGDKWSLTVGEAIKGLEAGEWEFYIQERLEEIPVIGQITGATKSLTAIGQGYLHNLLEDLPECPD